MNKTELVLPVLVLDPGEFRRVHLDPVGSLSEDDNTDTTHTMLRYNTILRYDTIVKHLADSPADAPD